MNNRESLGLLFPAGTIKLDGTREGLGGRWFEVNGLEAETTPQNCEVLARADAPSYRKRGDYQTHYAVKIGGRIAWLRVCKAMAGSGYDAYAVGYFVEEGEVEVEHILKSVEHAQRW